MLLMGDEMRRTPAAATTTPTARTTRPSWLDWTLLERHADIHRFVRGLIRLRFLRESVRSDHHLTLAELMRQRANVQLHGVRLGAPDRGRDSHSLAVTASSLSGDLLMHFALNAYWEPLDFELPALPAQAPQRLAAHHRHRAAVAATTWSNSPRPKARSARTHRVEARSVVVMFAPLR